MLRWFVTVMSLVLAAFTLTGMGSLGGPPEGTVPKTSVNIAARVTDRTGVVTSVNRFSMDGKVSVVGRRGKGEVSLLVRDVKEISFAAMSGEGVPADLQLRNGEHVQLTVPGDAVFYGDTGYGAFWIPAKEVQHITFPQ